MERFEDTPAGTWRQLCPSPETPGVWTDGTLARTPITKGRKVKQANVYDPSRWARYDNIGVIGTVVGFGRSRVVVDFGHTSRSGEPKTDRVGPELLMVMPD